MFGLMTRVFETNVTSSRLHLFEWCDLPGVFPSIKTCCQDTLTKQWTFRLPFVQSQSPSELASALIQQLLDDIKDIDDEPYTVIDFCSGAGGPTPSIEASVNAARLAASRRAIPFRLSDIQPNLDAWISLSSASANLTFIPQPVDATAPPPSVISATAASAFPSLPTAGTKTIHLFCLSFHHFADGPAAQIMANMLETSDAFAIVELQDRSLGCVAMLAQECLLLLLLTFFWFPTHGLHLLFTYCVPVLPFVQTWDGVVSCLRTRTFDEVRALVDAVPGEVREQWAIKGTRALHTWPFAYMNAVVGVRHPSP